MKFYDTSALLTLENIPEELFATCTVVLQELEGIKVDERKSWDLRRKSRHILSQIDKCDHAVIITSNESMYQMVDNYNLIHNNDNLICASAATCDPVVFVTNDISQKVVAKNVFEMETEPVTKSNKESIKCCIPVTMNDDEMAYFYEHPKENCYGIPRNQYIAICSSTGDVVDYQKWTGENFRPISNKKICNDFSGKIQPRNPEQSLAFDLLQDQSIPVKAIVGKPGSGKSFLMAAHAIDLVRRGTFEKIVFVRNTVEVKNSQAIGFLPGTANEKLMPFAQCLGQHIGGQAGLDMFITRGQVELLHLGFARGRDIKNAIIFCSEAENLTREHMQLLLGRVGEGSQLWLDGDFKQVDKDVFRQDNGLCVAIERLVGHENFGFVELTKTERSVVAAMADLLD